MFAIFSAIPRNSVSPAADEISPAYNVWVSNGNFRLRESRVFANWDNQVLRVKLTGTPATDGLFIADNPYAGVCLLGCDDVYYPDPPYALSYSGTYQDATGTHKISGDASFFMDVFDGDESGQLWIMGVILENPDHSLLAMILWVPQDTSFTVDGAGPYDVQTAGTFIHSVKIT